MKTEFIRLFIKLFIKFFGLLLVMLCCAKLHAQCASGYSSGITGYYYNNISLTEPSQVTRLDGPIDFDWGTGAPGPAGIGTNVFSVRWTGYIRATQTGNYRFQTVSDDGVRLYVNGNLIINQWGDHAAQTDTSGNVALTAGQIYPIVLEFYENGGFAVMRLRWRLPSSGTYVAIPAGPLPLGEGLYECVTPPQVPISSCSTALTAGITGDYFNNQTLSSPITGQRLDGPINFDWGTGAPGVTGIGVDNFSTRWNGYLRVNETGVYLFQTVSDDGVRLSINGNLLINEWNDHAPTTHTSSSIYLTAGSAYPILLEWYENGGGAVIQLYWRSPSAGGYSVIPTGTAPVSGPGLYQCITRPSGFLLNHNATGLTCSAESIQVVAVNASGTPMSPAAGTVVTLSTTPTSGVWVGGNSYTFTGSENNFTRPLQQITPASLTMGVTDGFVSASSNITFVDTGLKIVRDTSLTPIANQVAGITSNAIIKAVRTDTNTGACVARIGAGTRPVSLAYSCVNPVACMAGETLSINSSNIVGNNNSAAITYTSVNLTFNANGEAPIAFNYSDVGQVRLHGQLTLAASGADPLITLSGSSDLFIVRPHSLVLTRVANVSGSRVLPLTLPANTTVNNVGFVAASELFHVRVQALDATANITSNFGRELVPETVELQLQSLLSPAGGNLDSLVSAAAFSLTSTPGEVENTNLRWGNVGTVTAFARLTDNNYLSAGDVISKPSVNIGRFYPNHFSMVSSSSANTCGSFSYMQQNSLAAAFRIEARSILDAVVSNYGASYGTVPTISYVAENANAANGSSLSSRVLLGADNNWVSGVLNYSTNSANFLRAATLDGPYAQLQLGLQLQDTFDVRSLANLNMNAGTTGNCVSSNNCNAMAIGSTLNMLFGRLHLEDAFGPETASLPVNFHTEYWTGAFWLTNTFDSCTAIDRTAITYPLGNIANPANLTVPLTGGSTQGQYQTLLPTQVLFTAGNAGQRFTAPNSGTGSFIVQVDLTAYPWLRFDWNQNGNHTDDTQLPNANFGFGSYRGHDRIIYWREIF